LSQEPTLACPLFITCGCRRTEPLGAHARGALHPIDVGVRHGLSGERRIDATDMQLVLDLYGTITACRAAAHERFREAAVGQQIFAFEGAEDLADLVLIVLMRPELAFELDSGVLAPREQIQSLITNRALGATQASASCGSVAFASAGSARPSTAARILASISCAISGFFTRCSRTLSRP
jgi:hypothetical protein